jgi:hypothetical protein
MTSRTLKMNRKWTFICIDIKKLYTPMRISMSIYKNRKKDSVLKNTNKMTKKIFMMRTIVFNQKLLSRQMNSILIVEKIQYILKRPKPSKVAKNRRRRMKLSR